MGLDLNGSKFLLYAKESGVDFTKSMMIGRQELHLSRREMSRLLKACHVPTRPGDVERIFSASGPYADEYLRFIGSEAVDSTDYSGHEGATHVHDMNQPIPDSVKNRYSVVIDGGSLAEHPAAAIAAGSAAAVDVLVGTNRDEWRFWTWANAALRDIDDERLERQVSRLIGGAGLDDVLHAAKTVETYRSELVARSTTPPEPADVYSAFASDWTFRVPAMRLATGCQSPNVYAYLFDWESPFAGGALGSCHALDLPFVFGSCTNPFVTIFSGGGEEAEQLSQVMRRAWTSFARTGDPSNDVSGEWPRYDATVRATKRLGRTVEVLAAPMEVERAWLDDALGPYGVREAEHAARVHVPDEGRQRRVEPATGT